jgi:hypothetical protein
MIKRHPLRNIILPITLLVPLIWLMTGCLYIPFFEHRLDTGPNIRALVGTADSARPIRPGHITKERVIALLGEAHWISDDGNALGYETTTGFSSWVYPICFFAAEPADARAYVVRFVFDKDGNLQRCDWAQESEYVGPNLLWGEYSPGPVEAAINDLNKTQPMLRARTDQAQWRMPPTTAQ